MARFASGVFLLPLAIFCASFLEAATWPGPDKVFADSGPQARELPPPSSPITVRLFIDATSSMKGFTGPGALEFPEQIQKLERAAHLFPSDLKKIECFKFGVKPTPPFDPPCYAALMKPRFFNLTHEQDKTMIQSVLGDLPHNALTVVVTDLFEDENDQGALFEAFKQDAFRSRLAVGIVAMMARFNGVIYDIGLEKGHRAWNSERPFYALVVGEPGDLTAYFERLESEKIANTRLLILSDVLLRKPMTWDTAARSGGFGVAIDPSLIAVNAGEGSFGVLRLQRDDCRLDFALPAGAAPYRPSLNWSKVEVDTHVRRFPINQGGAEGVSFDNRTVGGWIGRDDPKSPKSPLGLHLAWEPRRIRPAGRVYVERIHLRVAPETVDFSGFKFVDGWSATPEPGKSAGFDGGKTQYLSEFIRGLWTTLVETEHPNLGSVYVYFQP